jgi:hypothetical protein
VGFGAETDHPAASSESSSSQSSVPASSGVVVGTLPLPYRGNVLHPSEAASNVEAVIDEGGNGVIAAEQLPHKYLPQLSWEDFEAANRLATEDTEVTQRSQ